MPRNTFDLQQLNTIADKLAKMPPPEKKLDKTNAIRHLEPTIRKLQKGGFTMRQISDLLSQEGIAISRCTLQSALKKRDAGKTAGTGVDR